MKLQFKLLKPAQLTTQMTCSAGQHSPLPKTADANPRRLMLIGPQHATASDRACCSHGSPHLIASLYKTQRVSQTGLTRHHAGMCRGRLTGAAVLIPSVMLRQVVVLMCIKISVLPMLMIALCRLCAVQVWPAGYLAC